MALGDKIEWTCFRVPLLKGEELKKDDGKVQVAWVGDAHGKDGLSLDRSRLVHWVLRELQERKWVGKCPILSNA